MKNSIMQVRILPGNEFYDAQERMHRYLLSINDDAMLYHFRKASGRDTKGAEPIGGWDAEDCKLKGHTTGHYLSALALCFRATGDEKIRQKAAYMVRELAASQDSFARIPGIHEGFLFGGSQEQFDLLEQYTKYPEIWAPYYTLHKIMAGLLDCYQILGDADALAVLLKMGTWVEKRLSRLPKEQLRKMWSLYIAGEFGGLNEVMAKLAAYAGSEEGADDFIRCAKLFDNPRLFTPLIRYRISRPQEGDPVGAQDAAQGDGLDGLHANQHIPQIIGALEIYKATGEEKYLHIARTFWDTVTENRTYAPGGVGEGEMFRGFREIAGNLTAKTMETCASYNMLKLTKALYELEPDSRYMDYYERTMFNHILATPAEDDSGESTYFFPLNPGGQREFLRENSCCHGTGMENHFRYSEAVFHRRGGEIYINLYIPAIMTLTDSGDTERQTSVRVERISQRDQHFRITVEGEAIDSLYLRKPVWAGAYRIISKEAHPEADANGYIRLSVDFRKNSVFDVYWDPGFYLRRTPDDPKKAAVCYGPYVMAALSGQGSFLQTDICEEQINDLFKPLPQIESVSTADGEEAKMDIYCTKNDKLHYRFNELTWFPLYETGKMRYHVYIFCF